MASVLHAPELERVHHRTHAARAEAGRAPLAWIEGPDSPHRLRSPRAGSPAGKERKLIPRPVGSPSIEGIRDLPQR